MKLSQRDSNNIMSKVRQSFVKAKKVIIGRSSCSKTLTLPVEVDEIPVKWSEVNNICSPSLHPIYIYSKTWFRLLHIIHASGSPCISQLHPSQHSFLEDKHMLSVVIIWSGPCTLELLQQYFLANEQCFSLTINQHKPNFNKTGHMFGLVYFVFSLNFCILM